MKANGYFEFLTFFEELPDPRLDRGQNHLLIDMVALALCGTICGADTWADIERFSLAHQEWFEQFLELPNGVPSHDTFGRVFRCLDTAEFQACLSKWVEHLQFSLRGKTISIDGKTLRGSHDHAGGQKPCISSMQGRSMSASAWAASAWMIRPTRSRPCRNCCRFSI